MKVKHRVLGGSLLVAGTTIGGAVLALPVSTGMTGFYPALCLFVASWAFFFYSALLLLEVNLWMDGEDSNLISMAQKTLGAPGRFVAWILYLFLMYTLTTTYTALGGDLLARFFNYEVPRSLASFCFLTVFGYFVYRGTGTVDLVNRAFMLGLVITYALLMIFVAPHVQPERLEFSDWSFAPVALSVIATAFGYHVIIPSLTRYMHRNVDKLVKVILLGSLVPFFVYCAWEFVTLGVLPMEGEHGLRLAHEQGLPATVPLTALLRTAGIQLAARLFELFALITSFLGVALALLDFLADGLHINKTKWGRLLLCSLLFVPAFFLATLSPRAFYLGLEYAGVFGVVTLLGLLPVMMVWRGRYTHQLSGPWKTPGGKPALAVMGLASGILIVLQIVLTVKGL